MQISVNLWKRKFYEYSLRLRIQRIFCLYLEIFENALQSGIFLSDTNMYTCGRSCPEICEYAYVILLDPVSTARIINKHGVQQGCSFFIGCSDF